MWSGQRGSRSPSSLQWHPDGWRPQTLVVKRLRPLPRHGPVEAEPFCTPPHISGLRPQEPVACFLIKKIGRLLNSFKYSNLHLGLADPVTRRSLLAPGRFLLWGGCWVPGRPAPPHCSNCGRPGREVPAAHSSLLRFRACRACRVLSTCKSSESSGQEGAEPSPGSGAP